MFFFSYIYIYLLWPQLQTSKEGKIEISALTFIYVKTIQNFSLQDSPCHSKGSIHPILQLSGSNSFPHEPELEGVRFPATLDWLVTSVVAHIVELVLLEEVGSPSTVASLEKTLIKKEIFIKTKNIRICVAKTLLSIVQKTGCILQEWHF